MAYHLPLGSDGCLSLKAASAITTPFVLVKFDPSNAGQIVVATDDEDAFAGVLMAAVAAGEAAKVFAQVGGLVPIATSEALSSVNRGLTATAGGYAHIASDTENAVAMNIGTAGDQYDIVTCVWLGITPLYDESALSGT